MAYDPKNELVRNRALKVESLVIPMVVTGNATPASVVLACDEGGFMYLKSQGVDQITAALSANETATYTAAPNDASGIINVLIKLRDDQVLKVCQAKITNRLTGVSYPAYLGSATGITTGTAGGFSIMLAATLPAINTAVTVDACLEVEYVVAE